MVTNSKTLNNIIGLIGAMQTLIENFPMSILSSGGKTYNSVIEFILDVLKQIGIDEITLTDEIIKLFFNVPNAVETFTGTDSLVYKELKTPTDYQKEHAIKYNAVPTEELYDEPDYILVDGIYYFKTTKISHDIQSDFVNLLEDNVKSILMNILTAILSCSIIPEIPDGCLDFKENERLPMVFPLSLIDIGNFLNICPTTDIGENFYNVDSDMTPNTVYKSKDLNAVIWYALNRGTRINQSETNKMMWDSRLIEEKNGNETDWRDTAEKWNYWLSSKKNAIEYYDRSYDDTGLLSVNGKTQEYEDAFNGVENETTKKPVHPILQFYPNNAYTGDKTLNLLISSQSYWQPDKMFNKSIYAFNKDYLDNIKIFSPRVIIASMINDLLNGNLLGSLNINYSIETKLIDAQIGEIIKRVLEKEDLNISDCFFSFSNEEFDAMLNEMETERYGGKTLNSETEPVIGIESGTGLEMLNQINSTATINEKLTTITKTVYDMSAIPTKDAAIEISDKLSLGYNNQWLSNLLMAIIRPIVKALLSPKVMLLFLIDFHIMGLINLDDIKSFNDILKIFYRKIMGAILSIVQYIKDKIIEFLLNLFFEKIQPLLIQFFIILLNEKLEAWILLLTEAMACIPNFKFSKVLTEIDDVNYADITQEGDIPENTNTC